jgi:histidinol-phosphate aminotransferase
VQIREAVASCDVLHIYPDPGQAYLRKDIASFLNAPGISADNICGGCGSDELLDLILRLFDPTALVNLPPTFAMYPFLGKISKVAVINIDRSPAPDFALDYDSIAKAVAAGASVIFAASPNNPTGGMLSHDEVNRLCSLNSIVVVDEAYAEFEAVEKSSVSLVPTHGNLIVLRTFSKFAGLAGLRVGYSVAHSRVNAAFMAMKQPYNVNVAADIAARAALANVSKIYTTQVLPMLSERNRMSSQLAKLGWLVPIPTQSNFVLFQVRAQLQLHLHNFTQLPPSLDMQVLPPFNASQIVASLRKRAVLVRYYPRGRLAGYIRISAGRPTDTDKLLAALNAIEAEQQTANGKTLQSLPEAVIFDMDGVLVDVSASYRQAIIMSAQQFGATGNRWQPNFCNISLPQYDLHSVQLLMTTSMLSKLPVELITTGTSPFG